MLRRLDAVEYILCAFCTVRMRRAVYCKCIETVRDIVRVKRGYGCVTLLPYTVDRRGRHSVPLVLQLWWILAPVLHHTRADTRLYEKLFEAGGIHLVLYARTQRWVCLLLRRDVSVNRIVAAVQTHDQDARKKTSTRSNN